MASPLHKFVIVWRISYSMVKSNALHVTIIGDSTSFWVRPKNPLALTYPEIISSAERIDLSKNLRPGLTFHDVVDSLWFSVLPNRFDVYIFALGINDITPRTAPLFLAKKYSTKFEKSGFLSILGRFVYRCLSANKLQTFLAKVKLSRPWSSTKYLDKTIMKIEKIILEEKNSKIIFLKIPTANERVVKIIPTINNYIKSYNNLLNKHSKRKNISLIDIDLLFGDKKDDLMPEGIHFSSEGHRLVAQAILEVIRTNKTL